MYGTLRRETRTVSISIYDSVQGFDYAQAGQTSLALLFSVVGADHHLSVAARRVAGVAESLLSGGEGQRVALARALAPAVDVLLAFDGSRSRGSRL